MPIIILPWVAVGIGVWGVRMLWSGDASADRAAWEILKKIPGWVRDHVDVRLTPGGVTFSLKPTASPEVVEEFARNFVVEPTPAEASLPACA